jgi:hypothetical protein
MPRSGLTIALSVMVRRIKATTSRKQRVARRGKSDALLAQRITSSERLSACPAAGEPGDFPGRGGSAVGMIVPGRAVDAAADRPGADVARRPSRSATRRLRLSICSYSRSTFSSIVGF